MYNHTDSNLELFVWAVSIVKGKGDATDLTDDLSFRPVNWDGVRESNK